MVVELIAIPLLVVGYIGATQQHKLAPQILWLDLAVLGTLLGGVANGGWLLLGRHAISAQRRKVLAGLSTAAPEPAPDTGLVGGGSDVMTVEGSTWYHRPDCVLVRDKELRLLKRRGGFEPCDVCEP
jgi:hypothetical protein